MTDLSLITHLYGIVIWYFGNVKTSGKLSIITQKQNKKQTLFAKENGYHMSQNDAIVRSSCLAFNVTPFQ